MADAERARDRRSGGQARGSREPDPETDAQTAESLTKDDGDRQSRGDDDENDGYGKRQKGRAEPDRDDRTDAHKPRSSDSRNRRSDARGAGRLPVESESRAATDSGGCNSVDERADAVAGDRVASGQLAALRSETGAPRATAAPERRREAQSRDREERRIRRPRVREPFVDGRKQVVQHDLPRLFGIVRRFPRHRFALTPPGHRIATVSRRGSREVRSPA
jgi:hypothetical protein